MTVIYKMEKETIMEEHDEQRLGRKKITTISYKKK